MATRGYRRSNERFPQCLMVNEVGYQGWLIMVGGAFLTKVVRTLLFLMEAILTRTDTSKRCWKYMAVCTINWRKF